MRNLSANTALVNHYIQRIYQATLEPDLIYDLVDDLRRDIDAPYGAFQVENITTHRMESGFLMNYDQKAIDEYARYYIELDPWTAAGFRNILSHFSASHKLLADKEYCHSEFYRDWGRVNDVRYAIGSGFDMENGSLFKVSFQRHACQPAFDEDIENFLNILHPHLTHFVQLSTVFSDQAGNASLWLNTLDTMARPIWILNRDLRMIYYNACAEEWMSNGHVLSSKYGHLRATNAQQQQMLMQLVSQTADILDFDISKKTRQKNYWRHHRVVLGHHDQLENFWLSPFATHEPLNNENLVLMTGRKPIPDTTQLTNSYGLTNRQAQLCALLMEGRALSEASQHLNISINTVRNVLAACFHKLGVKNQSELIQLLFNGM
ncbi:LuxR family transcriptional regulator [Marinomonas agarivorans]|nr:LuxR family transcriptional regulator [Marinomonas agarivorans]